MFWSEIHIFMIRMLLGDPPALDYEQQSQLPNLFCRLWQQVLVCISLPREIIIIIVFISWQHIANYWVYII